MNETPTIAEMPMSDLTITSHTQVNGHQRLRDAKDANQLWFDANLEVSQLIQPSFAEGRKSSLTETALIFSCFRQVRSIARLPTLCP